MEDSNSSLGQTFGASLGGTALGSAISGAFSLGGAALQNKYNKEMAALQNQYNIDMWNMQNEYNTPTAQMQRLVDAGLSPNLAYGQVSSGVSSKAPDQIAPQMVEGLSAMGKSNIFTSALSQALSILSLKKDIEQKDANINYTNARAREAWDTINSWGAMYNAANPENPLARPISFGMEDGSFTPSSRARGAVLLQNLKNAISRGNILSNQNNFLGSKIDYQKKLNEWYEKTVIFNMVDKGVGTLLKAVMP